MSAAIKHLEKLKQNLQTRITAYETEVADQEAVLASTRQAMALVQAEYSEIKAFLASSEKPVEPVSKVTAKTK